MSWLEDEGIAVSVALILVGLALALPYITLGDFGFDFTQMPTAVISVLRLGIIALAVSIGVKPLQKDNKK